MNSDSLSTTFTILAHEQREIVIDQPGDFLIELVGEGAEVSIKGAFEATGEEKKEISLVVHHKAPHTRAQTILKGVAADRARVSFKGKIKIDENCPDTHSFLTERILLTSRTARAEAIPELEILSDDVKCSHAASIAKISEHHLFYFQSRGIDRVTATKILSESFLVI